MHSALSNLAIRSQTHTVRALQGKDRPAHWLTTQVCAMQCHESMLGEP